MTKWYGCFLNSCLYSYCLTQLQAESLTFFSQRGALAETGESHSDPITTTYEQMFDELSWQDPFSLELLRMLAFLPPIAVSAAALQQGASAVDGLLVMVLSDIVAFDFTIAELLKRSLLEVQVTPERTFRMHPIVRLLLQASLSPQQRNALAHQAEYLISSHKGR